MVAYHFAPDIASGTHRSLHFARCLEAAGHRPYVLTASLDAIRSIDPTLNALFPFPERVVRVRPDRTLGDYYRATKDRWRRSGRPSPQPASAPTALASPPRPTWLDFLRRNVRAWDGLPDALRNWYRPAVRAGAAVCAERTVRAVFASGPPWTGVRVGAALARRCGCPLVADFRDPWTDYPKDLPPYETWWARRIAARWQRRIIAQARLVLCNTPAMERSLRDRYADPAGAGERRIMAIPNGSDVPRHEVATALPTDAPLRILHLGRLYRGRSVAPLATALDALFESGLVREGEIALEVIGGEPAPAPPPGTRGAPSVPWVSRPDVPFHEAVSIMTAPAVLLVAQEPDFDRQIPTKVYDYLCTGNPVLVLADEGSATWGLARAYARCLRLDHHDVAHNVAVVSSLVARWRSGALMQERAVEDTAMLTKDAVGEQFVRAVEGVLAPASHDGRGLDGGTAHG